MQNFYENKKWEKIKKMYTRNRKIQQNPPPADWDMCHKNGETLYRCPAYIKLKGTNEIRRCTICKKKVNGKNI